jgi:hypothetical protein
MKRISLHLLCVMLPVHSIAHPGHGALDHGVSHALTSPFHIFLLLVPAFAMLAVVRFIANERAKSLIYLSATALLILAAIQTVKAII